jgi:hypothetical protein
MELLEIPSLKLLMLDGNSITNVPPIRLDDGRKIKISFIANPIQTFAPENEPLVQRGVIDEWRQ